MTLSLEEITTSFQEACATESQSMFLQGDILVKGIRDGLTVKDVFKACGKVSGKSYRTVCNRFKTSKVFPADKRAAHIDWSLHNLCTTGVDLDKPDTYAIAYQWLDIAVAGRSTVDEDGKTIIRPHSFASLKAQITASGGNPGAGDVVYILDNARGFYQRITKMYLSDNYELSIVIPDEEAKKVRDIRWQEPLFITITQQPVQAHATESEAAS